MHGKAGQRPGPCCAWAVFTACTTIGRFTSDRSLCSLGPTEGRLGGVRDVWGEAAFGS